MPAGSRISAAIAVTGRGVERDLVLEVDAGGRFVAAAGDRAPDARFDSAVAVLPGLVNAHSHAFQRALRGRGAGGDFWKWREAMYRLAGAIGPGELEAIAEFTFIEMLLAGITTVGEFHYLHHAPSGAPYADPDEMASALVRAAEAAGIRLVLLRTAYARSAPGKEAQGAQRRFVEKSPEAACRAVERLRARGVLVGLAPHSLRAAPVEWFGDIAAFAQKNGLVVHSHVSETTKDVELCLAEHGKRPFEVLGRIESLRRRFIAVHATHTTAEERSIGKERAFQVCVCPTTERHLGDGIPELGDLDAMLSVGSDCHEVIDLFEEVHLLDRNERSRIGRPKGFGEDLLGFATAGGASALGQPAGYLAPRAFADIVAVDPGHSSKAPWRPEDGSAALMACARADSVREVWVGGRRVVEAGRHAGYERARERFERAVLTVFG